MICATSAPKSTTAVNWLTKKPAASITVQFTATSILAREKEMLA